VSEPENQYVPLIGIRAGQLTEGRLQAAKRGGEGRRQLGQFVLMHGAQKDRGDGMHGKPMLLGHDPHRLDC
jgi:hypothetical protein